MKLENYDEWWVDIYLEVDILGLYEVFVETEGNCHLLPEYKPRLWTLCESASWFAARYFWNHEIILIRTYIVQILLAGNKLIKVIVLYQHYS